MISEEEFSTVLKEFKTNKTPGTDGFSAKFYKFFWSDLGTEMTQEHPTTIFGKDLFGRRFEI